MIAADGSQAGVMSRFDALDMAKSAELDLVEVSPTAVDSAPVAVESYPNALECKPAASE